MSVIGMFFGRGSNGFGHRSTAEQVTEGVDLSGKTFLLTGCNSGIGHETARVLGLRGARVIGAARTLEKATDACADFGEHAIPVASELSDPDSVRAAVQAVKETGHALDGILCNAGIMALPERTLHNGYEAQFYTNHVGHFMLVVPLLDQLTDTGRVVMTSSTGHTATWSEGIRLDDLSAEQGYSAFRAYGQSKLANILFSNHLATRLKPGQTANAVHPGVIQTNLGRNMNVVVRAIAPLFAPLFFKSIPQGAATQTYVAAHPDAADKTGLYWADCNPKTPSQHAQDAALAKALWDKTEAIVAGLP